MLLAALAMIIAAAGFGGLRLYNSSWLTIQDVQVRGTVTLDDDAIREAAALEGKRYLSLDTGEAAARVRSLARVKDVKVARGFPHTASITVTERVPIGIWQIGATSYLVDGDGQVIDTTDGGAELPVVDATRAGADVQIGDHVDADALRVAKKVAESSPPTPEQSVVRFVYDKQTGLTAITQSGTQVRLGDGQGLDYKLAVWQQLALKVNSRDLHELDLRFGDRPFYR